MKLDRILHVSKAPVARVVIRPASEPAAPRAIIARDLAPSTFSPEFTSHTRKWFVDVHEFLGDNPSPLHVTSCASGRDAQEAWSMVAHDILARHKSYPFVKKATIVFKGARPLVSRVFKNYPAGVVLLPSVIEYEQGTVLDLTAFPRSKSLRVPLLAKRQ